MSTLGDINTGALQAKAFNGRWAVQPSDVIPLTAADPDYPVCKAIIDAIKHYVNDGYLSYGPFLGLPSFREAVANHFNTRKQASLRMDHVLAVNSAAQAMMLVARYVLKEGDEAIILDPVDFLFARTLKAIGVEPTLCPVDTETGNIDVEALQRLIGPKTKLISICNPHNPLGRVYTRNELQRIGQIAQAHDLWVMSDEIWSDIVYDQREFTTFSAACPEWAHRSFTVYGFSKTFGLAGLRIGALICNDTAVLEDLAEKEGFYATIEGVSTLSQIAAEAGLRHGMSWFDSFLERMSENRHIAHQRLNESGLFEVNLPSATYVIFPKITIDMKAEDVVEAALNMGKVAVVPGSARWFGPGAAGRIRICYATSPEILNEGLDRLFKSLK
jgi:aspartate/methionine/tyrosine aminotransferase